MKLFCILLSFLFVATNFTACGSDDKVSAPEISTESSDAKAVGYSSSSISKKSSSSTLLKKSSSSSKPAVASELSYGTLVDERDGQQYKTIVIGTQTWMAENLNYAINTSYCYQNSADYCEKYGRLYTYYDADTVCPKGYRLPSQEDFAILLRPLSTAVYEERLDKNYDDAVFAIKSLTDWEESPWDYRGDDGEISKMPEATNSTGFSALPAGYWNGRNFSSVKRESYFWCTTDGPEHDGTKYAMDVEYRSFAVSFYWWEKTYAYSVRCILDN